MEQMLYSLKRSTRILNALHDTLTVFEDDDNLMKKRIIKAIDIIETKVDIHEGLAEIENGYENDRLFQLHRLIMKIERIGGDYNSSITLLLEGNKNWADRISLHQKEIAKQRSILLAVIGINVLICGCMLFVLPEEYNITHYKVYQFATTVFFIALLFLYAKMDKKMAIGWIDNKDSRPYQEVIHMYEDIKSYDEKKEQKKSLCYALVPAVGIVAVVIKMVAKQSFHKLDISILTILLAFLCFCLNQHKIGHRLSVKIVTKELEKKFPVWLMEVALRSQVSNIHMAIIESYDNCSKILEPPLKELITNLERDPVGIHPYTNFLKEFNVPEIHSAMKMFYAMAKGNGGNINEQISEIISRNNKLMDKSEKIKDEDQISSFQSMQYIIMALGICELLVDMFLFVIAFTKGSYF